MFGHAPKLPNYSYRCNLTLTHAKIKCTDPYDDHIRSWHVYFLNLLEFLFKVKPGIVKPALKNITCILIQAGDFLVRRFDIRISNAKTAIGTILL